MILLWSLFLYGQVKGDNLDQEDFFRLMRLFYLRFFNYNRSVSKLAETIENLASKGLFSQSEVKFASVEGTPEDETDTKLRTDEETIKYRFLSQFTSEPDKLRKYESLIWEIEDHKFNRDASYVGNINISHLVDLSTNPTIEKLQNIKDSFYELMNFEEDRATEKNLITLLLHYGAFWQRDSPWYYYNYKFDNWKNIVRDRNSDEETFKKFFAEYISAKETPVLTEMINAKNKEFLSKHMESLSEITDFGKQLIVYAMLLDDIWATGNHMCYDEDKQQRLFATENHIFNTKRYRDGAYFYLWEKCIEKHKNMESMINHLKQELLDYQSFKRNTNIEPL